MGEDDVAGPGEDPANERPAMSLPGKRRFRALSSSRTKPVTRPRGSCLKVKRRSPAVNTSIAAIADPRNNAATRNA